MVVRLSPPEIGRAMRWSGVGGIVAGFLCAVLCRLAEAGPLAELVLTLCTSYAVAILLMHRAKRRAAWRKGNSLEA